MPARGRYLACCQVTCGCAALSPSPLRDHRQPLAGSACCSPASWGWGDRTPRPSIPRSAGAAAPVEHVPGTLKRPYSFPQVRYRGLARPATEMWFNRRHPPPGAPPPLASPSRVNDRQRGAAQGSALTGLPEEGLRQTDPRGPGALYKGLSRGGLALNGGLAWASRKAEEASLKPANTQDGTGTERSRTREAERDVKNPRWTSEWRAVGRQTADETG